VQLKVLTLDVDLLKPSAQRAGDSDPRHADRALEVRGVIHSGCSIVESGVESGVGGGHVASVYGCCWINHWGLAR
jgi:hypothetical protein